LGTAVVHQSVHDEFLSRFASAVEQAPVGDPTAPVVYGPMMSERFFDRFLGWLDLLRPHHKLYGSTGTGRITSANPRRGFVGDPDRGWFCHPSVVDGVGPDDELYGTETFGPMVGVAAFETFDEMLEL